MSEESKHSRTDSASEPSAALTYGMSAELRNSDLLWRISDLDRQDKTCLIRYIQHEIEEDDVTWNTFPIGPQTIAEANERLDEAEEEFEKGQFYTETEVRAELKEEFPWLL